jgi:hypothetical protein
MRCQDWEEIFDCIADVVGASRCEFLGSAVAIRDSDRGYAVRARGFDIEVAVADHACRSGIERLLFEETTEEGRLAVMERTGRVRVHGNKVAAQGEFFEDPRGEIFALGGADEELPAQVLEVLQHLMDAGIDRVLLPAGGVVAQTVVVQESRPARLVGVRHEAAKGLVGGRPDEPVERSRPGDVMGFKGIRKASENAWFRVSEGAIEIEYCRPAHHHVISIAHTIRLT